MPHTAIYCTPGGCTICSTNLPDNSGTNTCSIFLLAGKIRHAGCGVVKWLIMKQNGAYLAIFCTSGFTFLLPVVWSDLATNRKPVGLVSKAIPAHFYIRQVNGVNWRDIKWCLRFLPSVRPSVCEHRVQSGKRGRWDSNPRPLAWEASMITTTPWKYAIQCRFKVLNACPATSVWKQNNDFYYFKR